MSIKQNSNDSIDDLPRQSGQKMKISLSLKSYTIKACTLALFISLTAGIPTEVNASFFGSVSSFIFGNGAQASETDTIDTTNNNDFGTDNFDYNSQNMQLLGTDSVDPNKKGIDDCPELAIDNGALQMDTTCGVGKGLESNSTGEMTSYVVQEGDTLSEIAVQFDVSLNTIRWENNLTGNSIKVGQKLNILPVTGVKHIIKKGDTLDKIATKYDAEVEDIMVFNEVSRSSALKQGNILYVPNGIKPAVVVVKPIIKKSSTTVSSSNTRADSGYYIRPTSGITTSPYGSRRRGFHYGVDIGNSRGTTVVAAASGVVSKTLGTCKEGRSSCGGRYGNYVTIEHPNGTSTTYAHLQRVSVSVGQSVSQGEQIGAIGNTGRSTGPHLHFEIENANGSKMRPSF